MTAHWLSTKQLCDWRKTTSRKHSTDCKFCLKGLFKVAAGTTRKKVFTSHTLYKNIICKRSALIRAKTNIPQKKESSVHNKIIFLHNQINIVPFVLKVRNCGSSDEQTRCCGQSLLLLTIKRASE